MLAALGCPHVKCLPASRCSTEQKVLKDIPAGDSTEDFPIDVWRLTSQGSAHGIPTWRSILGVIYRLVGMAAVYTGDCVQAVQLLGERMPKDAHAAGGAQGIAIGAWEGQQRVLGEGDAEKLLAGMQRMLHLKELGNRWARTLCTAQAYRPRVS